jgi:hypothetical protein
MTWILNFLYIHVRLYDGIRGQGIGRGTESCQSVGGRLPLVDFLSSEKKQSMKGYYMSVFSQQHSLLLLDDDGFPELPPQEF